MDEQSTSSQTPVKGSAPKNTNRWDTRQLVTMAVLVAIGVLISFIDFPLIPGFDFLKYDPSSVAMLVGTFTFGPLAGAVIGTLIALLHWSTSGVWGVVMNILAMIAMGVPAGLVYKRNKTRKGAALGLVVGSVVMVVVSILANLVVTPIYTGMPVAVVAGLIVPALLPFNVAKVLINSVITFLVYKSISKIVKPAKKSVPATVTDPSEN
ncbi:MAG: ECF transporter S component [Coriobacteriia bacterium]|nr:ECF transporter S component [Coriobacteriia bacterium]